MPKLRRYCWRVGIAIALDDNEKCPECGLTGIFHRTIPDQTKCGSFAAITAEEGGPCVLEIGHEGPHVPDPEQVQHFAQMGKTIVIGDDDG